MSYTPPLGDAVDFDQTGGYTPPARDAVDFAFIGSGVPATIGTLQGTTDAAGSVSAEHGVAGALTGSTEAFSQISATFVVPIDAVLQVSTEEASGQVQATHGTAATLQPSTESPAPALILEFSNERRIVINQAAEAASGPVVTAHGVAGAISAATDSIVGASIQGEWGVEFPRAGLNSSAAGQAAPWGRGAGVDAGPRLGHNDAPAKQRDSQITWQDADRIDKDPGLSFSVIPAKYADPTASWGAFGTLPSPVPSIDYSHPPARQPERAQPWDAFGNRPDRANDQTYSHPPPKDERKVLPYWHVDLWTPAPPAWDTRDYAPPSRAVVDFDFSSGYSVPLGDQVQFGWGAPYPYGEQPSRPKDLGAELSHNAPGAIDESRTVPWGNGSWTRPLPDYDIGPGWNTEPDEPAMPPPMPVISEVYIFMPNITLYRIPDGAEVEALSITWSTDADSWGWRFNATLKKESDLALLKPDSNGPREIGCIINGHEFKGIVEGFGSSRQFGQSGYTIKGRSLSAYLSDPYAPLRSKAIDAQYSARQLAEQELLNTGWTLNWQVPDWVVPGGAFSYQERDAIAVVKQIAEAIGGTVQTDPSLQQLHIKPRYPVSPHLWDNVVTQLDAILPAELIKTIGSEFRRLPAYNRSFVAGGPTGGVIVMVTRDGTAGDIQTPQIVDPLITHTDAGYERARNEIARGGNWETLQLETWLTQQGQAPGLLLPGHLVEIQDLAETYRSLISGTTVTATSTPQALTVRQQLTAERYNG